MKQSNCLQNDQITPIFVEFQNFQFKNECLSQYINLREDKLFLLNLLKINFQEQYTLIVPQNNQIMQSGLSVYSQNSNRKTLEAKKINFHEDFIIPNIYASQNFQIVTHNAYPVQPQRKAITAKKKRVQAVIQTILTKKTVEVSKKKPLNQHRLSRPQTAGQLKKRNIKEEMKFVQFNEDEMRMDIDERINDRALLMHQQTMLNLEKKEELMDKVKEIGASEEINSMNQTINFYITEVSPRKSKRQGTAKASSFAFTSKQRSKTEKKVKGWVEEIEQKQIKRQRQNKKWINSQPIIRERPKTTSMRLQKKQEDKQRIKSANTFTRNAQRYSFLAKSKSLLNTRLNRYEKGKDLQANIKQKTKSQQEKGKFHKLMNLIQQNCLENTLQKNGLIVKMNKMGTTWKSQKEFLSGFRSQSEVLNVTHTISTLSALSNWRWNKKNSKK